MTTQSILDCFKMAGFDPAIWEERNRDEARWTALAHKNTVYNAYLNWTVRREGGPDEASYNKYFPKNPNPQALTLEEQAEMDRFAEKYKHLRKHGEFPGYWLLAYETQRERVKLLQTTPLIQLLVEQDEKYLIDNGWRWPLKVKKLIEAGWIMSEIRVTFTKAPTAWWTQGAMFRLHAGGLQTKLHRVISITGDTITYEPAGYTNYGYMLIKPRSKRPTTESLAKFRQRECVPIIAVAA